MGEYLADSINLIITAVLIILNGFFVAAEFALVKVNKSKINNMQRDGSPFASVALWLYKRQSMALSACQMGITMASLALGWIGEPALAHLIHPLLESFGITSEAVLHGVAFTIAFTLITSIHIVIGEQFPKIYAIRKPVTTVGWSSFPLKFFYIIFFPFMWVLDRVTSWMLRLVGIESSDEHEMVLSEEEIRASLSIAHSKGELTMNEHRLLDAAFKFDDQLARQIMVPRGEVTYFDIQNTIDENMKLARQTQHTRFPLCNGSLDDIKGVVHIKDFVGMALAEIDLPKIARPPIFVPEAYPVPKLLQEFRRAKQHFAFVEDEYGTMLGIVTLENVLEQLVGNVEDEFDEEQPVIEKVDDKTYIIEGDAHLLDINDQLDINIMSEEADSLAGLLIEKHGYRIKKGQVVELADGVTGEVLQLKNRRATRLKLQIISNGDSE
jgi:CBS domain containing-hemolysin-like protein